MIGMLTKFPDSRLVFPRDNGQHLHLPSNSEVMFTVSDVSGDMHTRGLHMLLFLILFCKRYYTSGDS